jgi:hypothetical protein
LANLVQNFGSEDSFGVELGLVFGFFLQHWPPGLPLQTNRQLQDYEGGRDPGTCIRLDPGRWHPGSGRRRRWSRMMIPDARSCTNCPARSSCGCATATSSASARRRNCGIKAFVERLPCARRSKSPGLLLPTRKQSNWVSLNNRISQSDSDKLMIRKNGNWCRDRDAFVMKNVHHALRHYNARHPVCPLNSDQVLRR